MNRLMCTALTGVMTLALTPAFAQSRNTENTLKLDEGSRQPAATLADMSWLVGSWSGEAFGGRFEEVWSPASAGTMLSTFKLTHDGEPSLYEFQMMVQEQGSLVVKLKHFNPDFSAWEEKAEFVSFPLVKIEPSVAWFSGLTYRRVNADRIEVFVAVGDGDEVEETRLVFERARPAGGR
jgi:hypothetical protein